MMMKQKLFLLAILCWGTLSTVSANEGDKKKKSSTSKASVSKKAVTATRTPVKSVSKTTPPVKRLSLRDTIQSPGKIDTSVSTEGFEDLFEQDTRAGILLNARAVEFVEDYMDKNSDDLLSMKSSCTPYFKTIENILSQYGLPAELKYLAFIESQMKIRAKSWAGAVGPWQLMPVTARELGLTVTKTRDDRYDYKKSTHAAAKYLIDLYKEFGDWLLVIAAYNGGPGNVYKAIGKSGGSRNFWKLQNFLPAESRTHVKKFIGTHYIFEGSGGVTTLTNAEVKKQLGVTATYLLNRKISSKENANAKTIIVSGKYRSEMISKNIMMSHADFLRYNPDFDKKMSSSDNVYELKLPADKMELFNANKYNILNDSVQSALNANTAMSVRNEAGQ
ncbi:MAG: lytic transglycosylase domain-containing protein [Chitinophagaceae bacterium]|nr:MAG: lytic transglycosylase domain-containing protein [Chitinophagaceae bacterium]